MKLFVEGKYSGHSYRLAHGGSGIVAIKEEQENPDLFRENEWNLMRTSYSNREKRFSQ